MRDLDAILDRDLGGAGPQLDDEVASRPGAPRVEHSPTLVDAAHDRPRALGDPGDVGRQCDLVELDRLLREHLGVVEQD
jgi:hypothetical protein